MKTILTTICPQTMAEFPTIHEELAAQTIHAETTDNVILSRQSITDAVVSQDLVAATVKPK